jgi:hypothetical protein
VDIFPESRELFAVLSSKLKLDRREAETSGAVTKRSDCRVEYRNVQPPNVLLEETCMKSTLRNIMIPGVLINARLIT